MYRNRGILTHLNANSRFSLCFKRNYWEGDAANILCWCMLLAAVYKLPHGLAG